jgi:hypothetical protein
MNINTVQFLKSGSSYFESRAQSHLLIDILLGGLAVGSVCPAQDRTALNPHMHSSTVLH